MGETEASVEAVGSGVVSFGAKPDAVEIPGIETGGDDGAEGITTEALSPAVGIGDEER